VRVSDRELLAYAADALEPPRKLELQRLLAADPALARRLRELQERGLRRALQAGPPRAQGWHTSLPSGWVLPPPGLGELVGSPAPMMGEQSRLVRLSWPATSAEDDWVLMLERLWGDWQVVAPLAEEELVRVGQLPLVDGQRQLELAAGPSADRVGAVLVPARYQPDWALPPEQRWAPLLEGALAEGWPAGTVTVA
jgi:hypothetical protein